MTLLEPLLHVWLKLQSNNKTHEHSFAPWQRFCENFVHEISGVIDFF